MRFLREEDETVDPNPELIAKLKEISERQRNPQLQRLEDARNRDLAAIEERLDRPRRRWARVNGLLHLLGEPNPGLCVFIGMGLGAGTYRLVMDTYILHPNWGFVVFFVTMFVSGPLLLWLWTWLLDVTN